MSWQLRYPALSLARNINKGGDDFVHGCLDFRLVADIGKKTGVSLQGFFDCIVFFIIAPGKQYLCPFGDKEFDGGFTDATGAAGDECDFIVQKFSMGGLLSKMLHPGSL